MLGKRDLGFPSPVFLVVVVVVPVIVFFLHRKWQQSVARSEEVKRLLASASEESNRVEFEAREAYYYTATVTPSARASVSIPSPIPSPIYASASLGSLSKPQYQCAVCFCPTTTRCAKCKAVRYCSGKCQIIHWRQGHKDECRPYVAVSPNNNVNGSSNRHGDHKDHSSGFVSEAKQTVTPSESKSPSSHEGHSGSSTPTNVSAGVAFKHLETVKSAHKSTVSPARKSTGSLDNSQKLSNSSDEDTQSGTSSSSFWTDDGSNEPSSLFEPSTNSFGSWDVKIPDKKSSIREHDVAPGGYTTKVVSNSNIMNGISTEKVTDGSAGKDLPTSELGDIKNLPAAVPSHRSNIPEKSNDVFRNKGSDLPTFKLGDFKNLPAAVPSHLSNIPEKSNDVFRNKGSDLPTFKLGEFKNLPAAVPSHRSNVPEKSNDVFHNKIKTPVAFKSKEVISSLPRASDTYLTNVTGSNISHSTKPVEVVDDDNYRISTCSSQSTEVSRSGVKTSKLKEDHHLKPSKLSRQETIRRSDTSYRYSFKGLFPYEMFIKLYNSKPFELQPFGLKNCGNSCYANAVLQCLIYTPPLTAYFLQRIHSKACDKKGWCFTCEFEGLVMKAKDGVSPLSPIRLLTHIENAGSNLGHGKEEDAHEFLRHVIDTLQSVCIKESRTSSLSSLEEETTLIGLTFGGYLRSKIVCMKCGGKSEQHERMMDLTVEIEGDIRTLEDALDKFTCTEILDSENKYNCNRCKSYEKAKKKLTLLEAPNVLTIALKRFQSGKFGKLNKSVHFPEILDMAPYVSGTSDKSPIYRLYGVVVHVDTMNAAFSGHYVCYVKNHENRWFKFDDSMVKEVDLQHVLTKGAYMLLYARCSPRAPRSIRSSLISHHHDPRKHKTPPSFASKPHSTEPWEACDYHPPHVYHRTLEEESLSSNDNSGFFSESRSCSTDSTLRDSTSIEDHVPGDWEPDYHANISFNSSDSDTSSSSSFPSPLYSRLSQLYTSTTKREGDGKVCRNLDCSCSRCRITNPDRLRGKGVSVTPAPGVTFRKSTSREKSG